MGKKLKAFSKVSVALALLGAAVPAVEAAPTAMAAKKTTKKAKKSTKKAAKKSIKKAKKAEKSTKKKEAQKVVKKTSKKKATKKSVKKVAKKKAVKKTAKKAAPKKTTSKKTAKKVVKKTTTNQPVKKVAEKTVKKTTPKKSTTAKKTTKKATPASAYVTVYSGKGNPLNLYVWSMGGKNEGKLRIKKGTKVVTGEQKVMNGQLMYRVYQEYWEPKPGDKHFWDTKNKYGGPGNYSGEMWVPAKDVQQDFFKDVQFIDYADADAIEDLKLRDTATPAQIKVAYDADLAAAEKDQASYREATAWAGILWDSAHPLESEIEGLSQGKTHISKNTYEKHNSSYAQDIREIALRPGGCYTKEAYTAYMKGEKAYREYEAKWAAKYPIITKAMNADYKKENVDVSKWHFNDNIYTVDNTILH